MKIVSDMPNSGRFVAVWFHEETGELWSDTLEWKDGVLIYYTNDGGDEVVANPWWYSNRFADYIIGEQ